VTIRGFKKHCVSGEMDGRMRKKLGTLAGNMKQDGNHEDTEAKTGKKNDGQRLVKLNEG
jgi:hypothetical protein